MHFRSFTVVNHKLNRRNILRHQAITELLTMIYRYIVTNLGVVPVITPQKMMVMVAAKW